MDDFELELKQGFLQEAEQLLVDTEQCFLSLEANPSDSAILEKIFRLAHNLKGSSKAVGFSDLGLFTHEFENLLLKLKKGELTISAPVVDVLLKCNDHIRFTIEKLKTDVSATVDNSAMMALLQTTMEGGAASGTSGVPEVPAAEEPAAPNSNELVSALEASVAANADAGANEIFVSDASFQSEVKTLMAVEAQIAAELVGINGNSAVSAPAPSPTSASSSVDSAAKPSPSPSATKPKSGESKSEESVRVSLDRLEKLINYVGEMVILQTVLREQAQQGNLLSLRKSVHQLGKVGKEIQDISMSLRMIPLKQTFQKMQRIVRDTSSVLKKKVQLVLAGEETELDKTVLESVSDPLVHLIRNAVDHGIESADARLANGKPEQGTVRLSAFHQGGKLVIEVADDGGGIIASRMEEKAREKGILRPGQSITRDQAIHLIFHPGFSTKSEVTEVSGRGVGMDVVKTNIESLQGSVEVYTEEGKGTTFRIVLPLTLAIIDGMVVLLDNHRFVIPLAHVFESYRPAQSDVKTASGLGEILILRGENLPLFRLGHILKLGPKDRPASEGIALIIRSFGDPFAILVDDILGQHQVVVKKLGRELQQYRAFSGSAIMGDGRPSLILELAELAKQAGLSFENRKNSGRTAA